MIEEIGKRIAELRCEKGLTQLELAEQLSVSSQAISKWETGGGFPDVQTIPKLACVLNTTTDYLLGSIRKQQKVLVFNVLEGANPPSWKPDYSRKYNVELNEKYLKQGWRVVQSSLSSEQEMTYMLVVIERDA
ncbi:MAG: helix-turn-helix transcriptional regulator [Oscillospiraceae bacterium]|nr:helix-turn-helix transcriptional regulator [Oscillospiraceae bacterium]